MPGRAVPPSERLSMRASPRPFFLRLVRNECRRARERQDHVHRADKNALRDRHGSSPRVSGSTPVRAAPPTVSWSGANGTAASARVP